MNKILQNIDKLCLPLIRIDFFTFWFIKNLVCAKEFNSTQKLRWHHWTDIQYTLGQKWKCEVLICPQWQYHEKCPKLSWQSISYNPVMFIFLGEKTTWFAPKKNQLIISVLKLKSANNFFRNCSVERRRIDGGWGLSRK